jgi:hypothetical protein
VRSRSPTCLQESRGVPSGCRHRALGRCRSVTTRVRDAWTSEGFGGTRLTDRARDQKFRGYPSPDWLRLSYYARSGAGGTYTSCCAPSTSNHPAGYCLRDREASDQTMRRLARRRRWVRLPLVRPLQSLKDESRLADCSSVGLLGDACRIAEASASRQDTVDELLGFLGHVCVGHVRLRFSSSHSRSMTSSANHSYQ